MMWSEATFEIIFGYDLGSGYHIWYVEPNPIRVLIPDELSPALKAGCTCLLQPCLTSTPLLLVFQAGV